MKFTRHFIALEQHTFWHFCFSLIAIFHCSTVITTAITHHFESQSTFQAWEPIKMFCSFRYWKFMMDRNAVIEFHALFFYVTNDLKGSNFGPSNLWCKSFSAPESKLGTRTIARKTMHLCVIYSASFSYLNGLLLPLNICRHFKGRFPLPSSSFPEET